MNVVTALMKNSLYTKFENERARPPANIHAKVMNVWILLPDSNLVVNTMSGIKENHPDLFFVLLNQLDIVHREYGHESAGAVVEALGGVATNEELSTESTSRNLIDLSGILDEYFEMIERPLLEKFGEREFDVFESIRSGVVKIGDRAMAAPASEPNFQQGGIDFDPAQMNLNVHSPVGADPDTTYFSFSPEHIEQMKQNITGLVPVIIRIQPISNLPLLLGLEDVETNEQVAKEG